MCRLAESRDSTCISSLRIPGFKLILPFSSLFFFLILVFYIFFFLKILSFLQWKVRSCTLFLQSTQDTVLGSWPSIFSFPLFMREDMVVTWTGRFAPCWKWRLKSSRWTQDSCFVCLFLRLLFFSRLPHRRYRISTLKNLQQRFSVNCCNFCSRLKLTSSLSLPRLSIWKILFALLSSRCYFLIQEK